MTSVLSTLYRALTAVSGPPLAAWLALRAARGKEIPARLPERRGQAARPRPDGTLVWFHGASVGEALSILPLVTAFHQAGACVLVTTGTVTSAALMAERLPAGCIHQFIPLDRTAWVRRFLDHWRPDLALWTESELWPSMLREIGRRDIPAVLLNARLSDGAFRRWQRAPRFVQAVLAPFRLVLAQSAADSARFAALGARDVRALGNIKLAAPPLPFDESTLADLRADIAGRPVWLAASIHPGEDTFVLEAHTALKPDNPDLLTLVVPRHPERARAMAAAMASAGLRVALRSASRAIPREADIYIADTMGELGTFFRLCGLVFMGKSLAVGGGQNPAEPALIGCALVLGPDMSNFREITAELTTAGAACQGVDAAAVIDFLRRLLAAPDARATMSDAGRAVLARHANAVKDTLDALAPYLDTTKIR